MDVEPSTTNSSTGGTQTTKSGRHINPPKRFADETFPVKESPERRGQATITQKVSPKRPADEEMESPDPTKKSKLDTGEGKITFAQPQPPSQQTRGAGGRSGPRGRGGRAGHDRAGPWIRNTRERWRQGTTGTSRNFRGGTIVRSRHFSKRTRKPADPEEKYIAKIPDATNDEVYCKPRFHVILKNQRHHYITVPLYSKRKAWSTQDSTEYLKVVRSGQAAIGDNPTTHNEVLEVVNIENYWQSKFLEQGLPSWARYLEPNSLDKNWELRKVAELEPESYDTLMNLLAQEFIVAQLTGQAQA